MAVLMKGFQAYSRLSFRAAAMAQGARVRAAMRPAASRPSCPLYGSPSTADDTALVAMINMGTYSGNTKRESSCPPRRKLTVSALPMAPSRLSVGVPRTRLTTRMDNPPSPSLPDGSQGFGG